MAARLTHFVLKVKDLDRSVDFYRRFGGLDVVHDGRPKGHTVWLGPRSGEPGPPSFVIVLYQTQVDARLDHVGFQCDSRAEVDRIAAEGARLGILAEPAQDAGGDIGYVTMLRDPDGHRVEFTCGQPLRGL
jgi:catechol 2,3-dioxygenase-like lactoylglutathione lyase family enzyme